MHDLDVQISDLESLFVYSGIVLLGPGLEFDQPLRNEGSCCESSSSRVQIILLVLDKTKEWKCGGAKLLRLLF